MHRNAEDYIEIYKKRKGYWLYEPGDKYHPILTDGDHSNGYLESKAVLSDDELIKEIVDDLVETSGISTRSIMRVISPVQKLAIAMAQKVNKNSLGRTRTCVWSVPVKVGEGQNKEFVFEEDEDFGGEDCLFFDDIFSKGSTLDLVCHALYLKKGLLLPFMFVIGNRPGLEEWNEIKIISLFKTPEMKRWKPYECPPCNAGSKPIRIATPDDWVLLNSKE